MNFAFAKISSSPSASAKYTHPFKSEDEMVATVDGILTKQKRQDDVSRVLNKVRDGGYYFFDLDLTREEAESLGWNDSVQR